MLFQSVIENRYWKYIQKLNILIDFMNIFKYNILDIKYIF